MPGNEKDAPGKGQRTLDQFFSRTSVCPENENPPREQQIDGGQSNQQAENDEALLRCSAPTRGRRFLERRSAPAVAAAAAAAAQQESVSEDIDMTPSRFFSINHPTSEEESQELHYLLANCITEFELYL